MKIRLVWVYVGFITALGLVLVAWTAPSAGAQIGTSFGEFWLLTGLALLGELFPIKVSRGEQEGEIVTSSIFVFALIIRFGVGPAILAQTITALISELRAQKVWWKIAFNAGQIAVSLAVAGLVLSLTTNASWPGGVPSLTNLDVIGVLIAAALFMAVNDLLVCTGLALHVKQSPLRVLRQAIGFHVHVNAVLLALAPVVVVAADYSLILIPLLAVPMAVMYVTATMYAERDYKTYQAFHDQLTGLPNRAFFYQRLERVLEQAKEEQCRMAIMIIDLDRFKEINDSLGHHVGDLLLMRVGPRLAKVLGESNTLARLGGDEFMVLLPHVETVAAAERTAKQILRALEQPFVLEEVSDEFALDVEASVGIACYPDHGEDIDTLMQRADVAMYLAKESHTGSETYVDERDRNSAVQIALLGELRRAMDNHELVLHYQPKVHLATGEVTGAEGLLRWMHPKRGVIAPEDFILPAERTSLIGALTLYTLERALEQWHEWAAKGYRLPIAVNLSRRNLLDLGFVDEVRSMLERLDVEPEFLEFEITESSIIADPQRASEVCNELNALGVRLSLDDYGAGYSSLSHLRRLPVQEIKIDKSFILRMMLDENDEVIVRSTIDLARNLGLEVVAEGVETNDVRDHLADLGCDLAQGYLISRPIPGDEFLVWLDRYENRDAEPPSHPADTLRRGLRSVV
ncbi:MAG: putative bifunctional diguanylate cyclase/phosphodiesterase [Actinomycetota bacterium]